MINTRALAVVFWCNEGGIPDNNEVAAPRQIRQHGDIVAKEGGGGQGEGYYLCPV